MTGAAGRMGAHLTRRLVADGHTVRAFVLPGDPNNQAIEGPGVEVVSGRLEDVDAVDAAVDGVDAIAALAGALTSRLASDRQFHDVNIGGTFNLLMAARAQMPRIQRFVYASSDAVYWSGWSTPPMFLPVDETHPRVPGSIYGATKVAAEELSLQFRRTYSVPSVVIRPTATADAWELIEPDSVFGRRIFLQACIRFLAGMPSLSADDEELLETLRLLDDGTEQLFVLADQNGAVPATNLADARDLAQGIHLALTRREAVGRIVQRRTGRSAWRGPARAPRRGFAGPALRRHSAAARPSELVRVERQGARHPRLPAPAHGLQHGRRGGRSEAHRCRRCRSARCRLTRLTLPGGEPVGKVVMYASVSVDGFVADESDQPGPLFDWLSSGDVPLDEGGEVKVSQTSYDYTRPYWDQIGATIVGRHVFDLTDGWDGKPPGGIDHVVVVTHRPAPEGWDPEAPFHFVDGVEAAMAKAQELAGDRIVEVAAGDVGGQALAAGLIDEVRMDVVPVVFGSGKRYFGSVHAQHLLEEPDVVIQGSRVLHLRYRVRR